MSETSLRAELRTFIANRDHVTFVEILREFPVMRGDGTATIYNENIVLWVGLSTAAVDMIGDMLVAKEVHCVPASILTYMCDGAVLQMPQVTTVKAANKYRKPHWLPVVFRDGPDPDHRVRRQT